MCVAMNRPAETNPDTMKNAVIKSFTDERERAKQPGYVCTYDDYDGDDVEVPSYGTETPRGAARAHGGHTTRSNHMQSNEAPVARDGFGSGIY